MSNLVFIYSSMNSGKSLSLLTKNFMLREKGFRTVLMKPEIDTRTSDTISTRLGIEEKCIVLRKFDLPSQQILKSYKEKPHFVFVDEAQFLSCDQVWDLAGLVDNWDIDVYCYGLKLDWRGEFFKGSEILMKISDKLEPIETYCKHTADKPAFFHIKLGGSGASVEIGEEDLYDTVSRKKWKEWWESRT